MTAGICSENGCERETQTRGMCAMHYQQFRRTHLVPPPLKLTAEQERLVAACRASYQKAADARATFLQAASDAIAAGVPESRLGPALGLSDAALRMLRKRGRLPQPNQQEERAA